MPDMPDEIPEIEILSSHAEKFDGPDKTPVVPGPAPEAPNAAPSDPAAEEWKQKHDEVKDRLLWMAADFDNFKKRTARDREENRRFAQAAVLKEVLSIGDNLERALAALTGHEQEATPAFAALKQGVEMVLKQFVSVLEKHQVTRIPAQGLKFDPRVHEVVLQEDSTDLPEGMVLEELESGYMIEDRVLRSARVKVSKKPS